jgi:4'-phosphopantetheinyl transferase
MVLSEPCEPDGVDARVWWCAPRPPAAALPLLSDPELARLRRLRRRADQERFATGRLLARTVLGELLGVAPGAVALVVPDGGGRPVLAGSRLSFSLSHSGERVALAVSATHDVGVDVERLAGAQAPATLFTAAEQDSPIAPITLWTRKEAVLKACGTGLAVDPRSIDASGDALATRPPLPAAARFRLADLDLGAGYAACVVTLARGG